MDISYSSSSSSSSVYSYSSTSEEEEEEENNNNINSSMSSSNSDTPNTNTIPQVIDENNDKSDSKLKVSPNLVEPTTTSALLKKENAESKDSSNLASSLPLSKNKSNNNSNNGTKSKILKDKNENKNKISKDKNETKNGTKKHKNLNSSSDTKKNHETATSLLEKILEKRPPLIQIKDGKDSNLKLKKKKNNNRSNKNEKRYGKKKKIRGTSNLETIKEDEELNNNKLPIRRVAKYTIDFKKDKPEQIIPHSMPRSRMPMSNKKQKIQNEIHSTLLNHTRQLQQRVFYLESKRLELQDLISDYELEKETLSKQLDKQTNSKVNYEKKIWELECKLYECNDSLNLTEESIAKLRNELEQKNKENHKYQEQLENLRFDFEQMRYDKDMEIDAKLKNIQFYKKKWEDCNRKIEKLEEDNYTLRLEFENTLKNLKTENKLHPDDDLNMILGEDSDEEKLENGNEEENKSNGNNNYYLPEIMEKSNSLNVYSLMQKNKLKSFSNQIDSLSTSLAEAHQENETLKERIDSLIQERDWLEKEKQDLSELLIQTQEMVEELEEEKEQGNQAILDSTSDNEYYIPNSSILITEDYDNDKGEIINVTQNQSVPLNLEQELMDSIDLGHPGENLTLELNPFNFGNISILSPIQFSNNNTSFINVNSNSNSNSNNDNDNDNKNNNNNNNNK